MTTLEMIDHDPELRQRYNQAVGTMISRGYDEPDARMYALGLVRGEINTREQYLSRIVWKLSDADDTHAWAVQFGCDDQAARLKMLDAARSLIEWC